MLAILLLSNPLLVPPTASRALPKLGPGFFDRYSQGSLGLPIRRSVGQQDTLDGICIQPGDELHRELLPAAGPFSYVLKGPAQELPAEAPGCTGASDQRRPLQHLPTPRCGPGT